MAKNNLPKFKKVFINSETAPIEVGVYLMVPSGVQIFSIANQKNFITTDETIVEVVNKCIGSQSIFVKPMQTCGVYIQGLMSKGKDEWLLSYEKTQPYNNND
jgi:hypothetical protein